MGRHKKNVNHCLDVFFFLQKINFKILFKDLKIWLEVIYIFFRTNLFIMYFNLKIILSSHEQKQKEETKHN